MTSGTPVNLPRLLRWAVMKSLNTDSLAGVASVLICLVVGLLAVLIDPRDMLIAPWLWAVVFVGFLMAMFITSSESPRVVTLRTAFAFQVPLAAVLVLTAPTAGWLPILLVFVAATSTYVVPIPVSLAVVAFNSVVIAVAYSRFTSGAEVFLGAGLYVLLQLATVLATAAFERERQMREQLTEAHAELQAAAAMREETSRADERLRISRELHDLLGHQLTALALELETASHRSGERAQHHAGRARTIARELLSDVRETVGELRRRAPDLRETLERMAEVPTPKVQITVAERVNPEEEQTVALVRIVQEVITNAIRHADASVLRIDIDVEADGAIILRAADDGTGAGPVELGNGLSGIVERVEQLGGGVDFDGSTGFRIEARLAA